MTVSPTSAPPPGTGPLWTPPSTAQIEQAVPVSRYRWATVTQLSPLQIRLDGDSQPLPIVPETLVDPLTLATGRRVWVQHYAQRIIVLGVSGARTYAPYWRAHANGSQSKGSGTLQNISWSLDREFDGGTVTALGISSYRQIIKDGEYRINGRVTWASIASPAGTRSADLRKNPSGSDWSAAEATLDRAQDAPSSTGLTGLFCTWKGPLVVGDIVGLVGLQTQGSNLDMIGTIHQTWLEIQWEGPIRT